jgi:hypothetical protein
MLDDYSSTGISYFVFRYISLFFPVSPFIIRVLLLLLLRLLLLLLLLHTQRRDATRSRVGPVLRTILCPVTFVCLCAFFFLPSFWTPTSAARWPGSSRLLQLRGCRPSRLRLTTSS